MSNTLMTIPLCQLKRSKHNVRKTDRFVDVEQMAASIAAKGVLENLIVQRQENLDGAAPHIYEVTAGGRRFAALRLLAKRRKIARDYPVPCLVQEKHGMAEAIETSLIENTERAPLHPADQFEAFAKLQKEGQSAEDIAIRFGLSPTVVLQRLKLAAVSPRLLADYRSGEMTLEQLMAFTITDDRKAQEDVWFENPFGGVSPQEIRRRLTKSHVEGHDRRARFVGVKAYEEAGGIIVRDLFDTEDEGYFTDSQLLDRLVAEKLQAESEKVRGEGWAWVETALDSDFGRLARFGRIKTAEIMLSEEDEGRIAALAERYDELVATIEEGGDDEVSAELDRVSAELDNLQARKDIWPDEEKGLAGAILSLDSDGGVHIERGLVKPEDRVAGEQAEESTQTPAAKKEKAANGYSESLLVDLSAHRTMALREVLASQPGRALTALLHRLVVCIFFPTKVEGCIAITPVVAELGKSSQTVGESKAATAFLERHNRWLKALPDGTELWDWLERLDSADRLELLAYCVAATVDAVHRPWRDEVRQAEANGLTRALCLDMADWWRPTSKGYFERVNKEKVLEAVTEGASREAAHRLAGRKKSQMTHEAETLLAATRWIPAPLRHTPPEEASESNIEADAAAE